MDDLTINTKPGNSIVCPCGDNCKCNPCTCGASVEGFGGGSKFL